MYHKRDLSKRRNISKVYYLAFEGKRTEQRYFSVLERERVFSRQIYTVRLMKGILEESQSNPKNIVKLVQDYKRLHETGEYSPDLFISHVFDHLEDSKQFHFGSDRQMIKRHGGELKRRLLSVKASNDKVVLDYESAIDIATEYFQEVLNREVKLDLSGFKRHFIDPSIDDEYCIIVDRDEKSFTEKQVEEVIQSCNEEHFRLIITNPCFELWLLLHFDVSKERIIECVEEGSNLKSEVEKYSKIYERPINGSEYVPALGVARRKLNDYAQELDDVKMPTSAGIFCIGSNIGKLLDDLTEGRYP